MEFQLTDPDHDSHATMLGQPAASASAQGNPFSLALHDAESSSESLWLTQCNYNIQSMKFFKLQTTQTFCSTNEAVGHKNIFKTGIKQLILKEPEKPRNSWHCLNIRSTVSYFYQFYWCSLNSINVERKIQFRNRGASKSTGKDAFPFLQVQDKSKVFGIVAAINFCKNLQLKLEMRISQMAMIQFILM